LLFDEAAAVVAASVIAVLLIPLLLVLPLVLAHSEEKRSSTALKASHRK